MKKAAWFLVVVMLSAGAAWGQKRDLAAESGLFENQGIKVYYECSGSGPDVVLLHGGNMDGRMWDHQFESFSARYRILRYDFPKYGRSSAPAADFSNAELLAALMTHVKMDRAVMVGLSFGGKVALDFALVHPERVRALVLAGPGITGYPWSDAERARLAGIAQAAQTGGAAAAVEAWLEDPYMAPAMANPLCRDRVREIAMANSKVWEAGGGREKPPLPPAYGRLTEIPSPTLVIVGERDVADIQAIADTLMGELWDVRKVSVPGAGHMVNMEKPTEFDGAVLRFLGGLSDGSAGAKGAPKPRLSAALDLESNMEKFGAERTAAWFRQLPAADRAQYCFREAEFNDVAYRLLQGGKAGDAISLLQIAVEVFPHSWNLYDSLGEMAVYAGARDLAEKSYRRSLELNPASPNGKEALRQLDANLAVATGGRSTLNRFKPGAPTGLEGPWLGQKPPGAAPEIFAPGVVSTAGSAEYGANFSPDGRELYFTRNQGIWVSRLEAKGWTAPEPASFSKGYPANEPHVTADNKRLFFGWFRPVPPGEPPSDLVYGIYCAERTPVGWTVPKYAGQGMYVTSAKDGTLFLTSPGRENVFLATTSLEGGRFTALQRLKGPINDAQNGVRGRLAHPGVSPKGDYVLFDDGNGSLRVSFRLPSGEWSEGADLTKDGLPVRASIASVSPDGRYIFFTMDGEVWWVSTEIVERHRPGKS